MNYVLTGYSGLIGSVLDIKLQLNGFNKLKPPFIVKNWTSPSTGKIEPDFRNNLYLKWLDEVKPDVFIHAGAIVGSSRCLGKYTDEVFSCNYKAVVDLACYCRKNDIYMVFFASDAEFDCIDYNFEKPIKVNETRSKPYTFYGNTKYQARLGVERMLGDKSLILYPSFVFGDVNDGNSCISEIIKSVLNKYNRNPIVPLDPDNVKQITPVNYACDIIRKLIEKKVTGKYPISSGIKKEYGYYIDIIRNFLDVPFSIDYKKNLDYKGNLLYDDIDIDTVSQLTSVNRLDDYHMKVYLINTIHKLKSIENKTNHDWENIDDI